MKAFKGYSEEMALWGSLRTAQMLQQWLKSKETALFVTSAELLLLLLLLWDVAMLRG